MLDLDDDVVVPDLDLDVVQAVSGGIVVAKQEEHVEAVAQRHHARAKGGEPGVDFINQFRAVNYGKTFIGATFLHKYR
jgi:hypothetical protein